MTSTADALQQRLSELESHLEQENPVLLSAVQSFRALDRVAYRMGLMAPNQSFATQIPWWPLISILGTFSAGKSTFINYYLGHKLQRSGNQAVDDRFTVVVYSPEDISHTLPGVALDSDPRFPFFRMSHAIEEVAGGEGSRIDTYLQLKTCNSERLRGKIIIDSPGFDADAQRTGVLRITDHMIDLSDLVLVFFDARHPEPGAMRDTLRHLVSDTIKRADAGKFLYILNQLDSAAGEDNPEDVVAAWLRSIGEAGLTAGRFYTIYCPEVAIHIADEHRRKRFEKKRDEDLHDIYRRRIQDLASPSPALAGHDLSRRMAGAGQEHPLGCDGSGRHPAGAGDPDPLRDPPSGRAQSDALAAQAGREDRSSGQCRRRLQEQHPLLAARDPGSSVRLGPQDAHRTRRGLAEL